ncbi:uncharacterized protein [Ptychodera flava]|uniref:uncharacterized protein n=1 Tax=Ptychodera flava TaxID=63121 RepID=UPI00396AA4B4
MASDPKAELAARYKILMDAFKAGDIETLLGLYTKDCKSVEPKKPVGVGLDAMRKGCEEAMATGMKMVKYEILHTDLSSDGEMAYMVIQMEIEGPDGSKIGNVHNTIIWKKVDGVYYACLDTVCY